MSELTEIVRLLREREAEHDRVRKDCVILEAEIRAAVRLTESGHPEVAIRGLSAFLTARDRVGGR